MAKALKHCVCGALLKKPRPDETRIACRKCGTVVEIRIAAPATPARKFHLMPAARAKEARHAD